MTFRNEPYLGLESALQKVLDFEAENIIELHPGFVEHTNANETTKKGITLKEMLKLFYQIQTITSS